MNFIAFDNYSGDAWSHNGWSLDGTATHECSSCPEFGPCPNQMFVPGDVIDRRPPVLNSCDVYWGSHGCELERGHRGHHECDHCECEDHARDHVDEGCVEVWPYYGRLKTSYYGKDLSVAEHAWTKLADWYWAIARKLRR